MIFVMKAGRHCRKPPLKTTEKDEEETQEAAASLADAKECKKKCNSSSNDVFYTKRRTENSTEVSLRTNRKPQA